MIKQLKEKLLRSIYAITVIVIIWWGAHLMVNSFVILSPLETLSVLGKIFNDKLWPNLLISYQRLVIATIISIVSGSFIGIVAGMSKPIASIIMPIVQLIYPIPRAAFLPLFLIFFGLKDQSKMALMVAISIFYFIIPFYDTVRNIPNKYQIIAKILNLTRIQWIWHVVIPACLSEVFTAIKMTIGASMATLFFAENISGSQGIAYYIMNSWGFSNYPAMYAGIIVVSIAGVVVFEFLDLIESYCIPWKNG